MHLCEYVPYHKAIQLPNIHQGPPTTGLFQHQNKRQTTEIRTYHPKKVFSFVYVVSSIFIVYMYSQTLSCSLTKVPEIPLITVKLTCIKRGTCIKRSPFGNGSLTAQYRLTVFLIQVWQTWDLFNKMKVKSEISIPRQTDLHLFLVPLRGPKEKRVKDHLTPYTVRPVALVWYVFPKWTFNGGEDNKK